MVLQYAKPYVSSEDIDKGSRWLTDIIGELETSYYGILFITKDNFDAPWLNFEAGALTKAVQKNRVSPFLFDLKVTDFSGPLTQFQASTFENLDVFKLLLSINRASEAHESLPEDRLRKTFEVWWPQLDQGLKPLLSQSQRNVASSKPTKEQRMIEEILELVRGHQSILRSPEVLFPQEYFDYLLRVSREGTLPNDSEAQEAVRNIERTIFRLKEEFQTLQPRIKGVPKSQLRALERLIEQLEDPMRLIVKSWNA